MIKIKYIIEQSFRVRTKAPASKKKNAPMVRTGVGEVVPAGERYNLPDHILNSPEYKFFLKAGKIKIYQEKELTQVQPEEPKDPKISGKTEVEDKQETETKEPKAPENKKLKLK